MLELRAGEAAATVDPGGGGRLATLGVGGLDLLTERGCFVMAPWAGRTGHGRFIFDGVEHALPVVDRHAPHAIHGTVRDRPWVVESADPRSVRLSAGLGSDWPWDGWCEQVITLNHDSIRLELSLHSVAERFPAVVGWHPWFTKPDHVTVAAAALLQRGDDHLPTGVRLAPPLPDRLGDLDDCFEDIQWPARLRWDDAGVELAIDATGCDHVVVFTEPEDATCVEPQTAPPNALTTGDAAIVTRGQPLLASTRWSWSRC